MLYMRQCVSQFADYISPKPWTDRRALAAHMSKHGNHIRSVVPPENLLEFHPSDGWDVLCKFLSKDIPNEPFPYINEGSFTVKTIQVLMPYFMVLGVGYRAGYDIGDFDSLVKRDTGVIRLLK